MALTGPEPLLAEPEGVFLLLEMSFPTGSVKIRIEYPRLRQW
jgi:hypothetical protein